MFRLMKTIKEYEIESYEQAIADLKSGILGYRTYGHIEHPELLVQVYAEKGIVLDIIAGDCVCDIDDAKERGYNSIMKPQIQKQFGENIIECLYERYHLLSFMVEFEQ